MYIRFVERAGLKGSDESEVSSGEDSFGSSEEQSDNDSDDGDGGGGDDDGGRGAEGDDGGNSGIGSGGGKDGSGSGKASGKAPLVQILVYIISSSSSSRIM
jgi:hypothetical protein